MPSAAASLSEHERALAPHNLVDLSASFDTSPIDLERPFRCAVLGSGTGSLTAHVAASHSHATVWAWAVDNDSIVATRRRCEQLALRNVELHERISLPPADHDPFDSALFDIIVAHDLLDATDDPGRSDVMRFVGQHLRPGGLFGVSYRTTIGWSQIQPVVALMRYVAQSHPGDPSTRVAHVLSLLQRLRDANAGYLTKRPRVAAWLDQLFATDHATIERTYLRHPLRPVSHAQVVDLAASIGCTFVGNALHDHTVELSDELDAIVAWAPTRTLRETYFDLAESRSHRVDVFRLGGR